MKADPKLGHAEALRNAMLGSASSTIDMFEFEFPTGTGSQECIGSLFRKGRKSHVDLAIAAGREDFYLEPQR
jgi:hypothetical protein